MRLLVLLLVGGFGAAFSAWALPRGHRVSRAGALVGTLAILGVTGAAFLLRPGRLTETGQPVTGLFDAHLVATEYLRLVVGLWGLESIVIVFIAWLIGGLPRLRGLLPATLAAMTGGTVAMASADLGIGAAAATATGLAALVVLLAAEGPAAVASAARELKVTLAAGATLLAAIAVVPLAARVATIAFGLGTEEANRNPGGVAAPALGIVMLAVALAVGARWGMLPFHVRISRLTDLAPTETLPLLLAWIPVPLAVVAFAMVDRLVAPLAVPNQYSTSLVLPLGAEQVVLLVFALVTLAGAAFAAFFHDDLRHAVGYLIVADAGLLILAIAALDPKSWGPGREWIIALAGSKTALSAWAAIVEDRFETRSIPELRGWARRSPLLAVALALVTLATYGAPGWTAFEARSSLAVLTAEEPWGVILMLAGFLTLPTYLRFFGLGFGRVTSRVDRAKPERLWRRPKPQELLPVELEDTGAVLLAGAAAGAGAEGLAPAGGAAAGGVASIGEVPDSRQRPAAFRGAGRRGSLTAAASSAAKSAANATREAAAEALEVASDAASGAREAVTDAASAARGALGAAGRARSAAASNSSRRGAIAPGPRTGDESLEVAADDADDAVDADDAAASELEIAAEAAGDAETPAPVDDTAADGLPEAGEAEAPEPEPAAAPEPWDDPSLTDEQRIELIMRRPRDKPSAGGRFGRGRPTPPGGPATPTAPKPSVPRPSVSLPSVPRPSLPRPSISRPSVPSVPRPSIGRPSIGRPSVSLPHPGLTVPHGAGDLATNGERLVAFLRHNRTELLGACVLALSILAALTSWGALDLHTKAAEPAPILLSTSTD